MQKIIGRPSTVVLKILFSLTRGYKELLQTSRLGDGKPNERKNLNLA
jgi:hypothetical protein